MVKVRISVVIVNICSSSSYYGVCWVIGCGLCSFSSSCVLGKCISFGDGGMVCRISYSIGSVVSVIRSQGVRKLRGLRISISFLVLFIVMLVFVMVVGWCYVC